MEKFVDILGRCEEKRLSYGEAAGILGMSERTFRRYRKRYEDFELFRRIRREVDGLRTIKFLGWRVEMLL